MAYNQDPPAETPIIKFKGQDFSFLRDYCLGRGLLFEDETFPAETSSIGLGLLKGHNLSRLMWKRPQVSEPPQEHTQPLGLLRCPPWYLPLEEVWA